MHNYSGKKIHNIIIFLFLSTAVFAQVENEIVVPDSVRIDSLMTVPADTIRQPGGFPVSRDAVKMPIVYSATDSMRLDMKNQKVYYVNNASAVYGDIDLKAYYIDVDLVSGEVHAYGRRDSAGKMVDTPVFKEGEEEFKFEELYYNFESKKARGINIVTEQEGELFMQSKVTKMQDDGSLHLSGSKVSTCDASHPHFYIQLPKAKAFPGEKIISGPAFLVLEDIPLPLVLPFGYFPVRQDVSSGLIIPKYGEERNRGLFLKEGGYYFNINDYFDLKITGDIYTNGTWRLGAGSNYRKRYKFSGNFAFTYANNVTGHRNLEDYGKSTNYSIRWSHAQDAKARPGSRFSASVNMSSSGYDRENSYTVAEHVTTTKQSSVSYSKSWAGTPFNFATSLNQSQNSSTKKMSLNLPKASLTMSRIYPLKTKKSSGSKWWQQLTVQYSANLDNRINVADSLLFSPEVWDNMKNGFKHDIPITLPLNPIKNLSISPQLSYSGVLYTRKMTKRWEENYYDPVSNDTISGIIEEEIPGFFYGQSFRPSISASYSPQLFGMYTFKNPEARVIAVRHVVKPSISFSYVPSMDGLSTDMYREVQVDTLGNTREYSIFEDGIYGTPSLPNRNGSLSLSLINIIEAKVRSRADTTGKGEKVKLIENLALNTSYNPFLDSLKWSPVALSFRTTLMKEINITARGAFDLYQLSDEGKRLNTLNWKATGKPARLTSFSASVGFDLKRLVDKYFKTDEPNTAAGESGIDKGLSSTDEMNQREDMMPGGMPSGIEGARAGTEAEALNYDEYGYADFSMPWSLKVNYNFNYSKRLFDPVVTQSVSMRGSLTLTKKWNISYTTGYDIKAKAVTMTRLSVNRDLHCWQMSFNWVPTGYLKSWDFTIRVKASVLQDIKYERRKDFHDNQLSR
ncbi:MAG: putative LPS assembly protein LptD [Marinilabiliaceae bacterium]|nr:putative LPS assembly protein LptD [Marinilabiliaceae bacterium]